MTSRSHAKLTSRASRRAGLGLIALAALVPVGTAGAAVDAGCSRTGTTVACEFWAESGTLPLPNAPGGSVDVMGYSPAAGGSPVLPGPTIVAVAGDTVNVTLHNDLGADIGATGMLFQEQAMTPDLAGVPAVGTDMERTKEYTFTASAAGTYLYEASPFVTTPNGGGSQYQTAMGMSGALVIRPKDNAGVPILNQAYDSAGSTFNAEHLVVLSELDTALTTSNATTFDMRDYAPDYVLINGTVSPDTANLPANAGDLVLLRWVDAGIKARSIAVLGARQHVLGEDGNLLPNLRDMVAETIGAGQTEDVIVTLPADASGKVPVYDAGFWFNNNTGPGIGGALTFLEVANPTPPDPVPGTTNVAFSGDDLTATVTDNTSVEDAEYFIDTVGGDGSGTAMSGTFGSPTVNVSALGIGLTAGPHTIYVHGKDAANWGPVSSVIVTNDNVGPLTTSLTLSPNPSNGSKDVSLRATGDDRATGGSNIAGGEYTLDGGTPVPVTPNVDAPVAALDTTIAPPVAGLAEGVHAVSVSSQDSAGNWGTPAAIDLLVDQTGPTTGTITANNSANQQAIQFKATINDPLSSGVQSNLVGGEGFIDTVGALGTGFPLLPNDGVWNETSEGALGNVPFNTLAILPDGPHTIYLRGRDASGNWGTTNSIIVTKSGSQLITATSTLTIARSNLIFRNGFENGKAKTPITGAGRLAFVRAANMAGTGKAGLRVNLSGKISRTTPASAYITDNSPAAESTYNARFYFNPNSSTPGGGANGITILAGYTANNGRGSERFTVHYRRSGNARQVRLTVRSGRGTASTRWYTIPKAAATPVEISWRAGASTTATLSLKGAIAQTLVGLNTGKQRRIESVRLGVQGLSRSSSDRSGTLYLDSFVSTRNTAVGP